MELDFEQNNIMKRKIYLLFLLIIQGVVFINAQRAIDIMPFGVTPPFPVQFSAYIDNPDKVSFMIKNNLFEPQHFFLEFELHQGTSVYAYSRVADVAESDFAGLMVEPAGILHVTGSELQMIYAPLGNFVELTNGDDGASLLLDGALPEGMYQLCFRAVDVETKVPLSEWTCSMDFFIQDYPAPEFQPLPDPYTTNVISPDATDYFFQWRHDIALMGEPGLSYQLKMIELNGETDTELLFVDEILLDNPGDVFFEVNTMDEKIYDYNTVIDPPFVQGKFYAARVSIIDELGNYRFENNGRSRPAILYCGTKVDELDKYQVVVDFPLSGDTLPFASTPLVVEFKQEDLGFDQFSYQFSINGQGNINMEYVENGPYDQMNSDQPDHILATMYLSGQGENADIVGGFVRGETYRLKADNIQLGYPDDETGPHTLPAESAAFVFGMPIPQLSAPSNGGEVEATDIELAFSTGNMPREPFPNDGFRVDNISVPLNGIHEIASVHEKYVVQVATSTNFEYDSIMYTHQDLIQVTDVDLEPLEAMDALYKSVVLNLDIELQPDTYYWRVAYLKDPFQELSSDQLKSLDDEALYHTSQVFSFNVAEPQPEEEAVATNPDNGDCNNTCFLTEEAYEPDMTPVTSRSAMADQNAIQAGRFMMQIENISFSGDQASGTGKIDVNFYGFEATIKVAFSDIKVNAQSQLIDGMIKAQKDELEIDDVLASIGYEGPNPQELLTNEQADMINNVLETYRQISALGAGDPIGMPIGLNYEYGDVELLFGITNMSWEPRESHCQILMNVPLMMFDEVRYLSLGASRVCITPAGFGPEATLHMVKAFHFDVGDFEEPLVQNDADMDNFTVSLLGPEDLDNQENIQATKLSFDCNGIKDFGIRGKIQFPSTMLRKEDELGNLITTERAAGTFYFALGRDRIFEEGSETEAVDQQATSDDEKTIHIVAEIESMDQFQIVGLRDWSIGVERAYFDFSQLENAIAFEDAVPEDYSHSTFADGEEEKHWQGFWLKESKLRLPNFLNEGGERMEVNVSNMIIDDEYFTANINIQPDLQGTLEEGWSISLDSIWIQITESMFRDGGFKGEIGTPFITENMEYTSVLSYEDEEAEGVDGTLQYAFTIRPAETVSLPGLMANANLSRETYIRLGYQADVMDTENEDGQDLVIEAAIAGGISISTEFIEQQDILSSLPFDLSLMELPFLLKYSTIDGFDGYFGFSPESSEALSAAVNEIQNEFVEASDDLTALTDYLSDPDAGGEQGKMAGFSFGIREMDIRGDGLDSLNLVIHPFINLVVDEENGFGGSAKLTLVAGYDSNTEKIVLKSPYVLGASVDIDCMFSGIGVKGGICFYNLPDDKGVKGFIDVALPIVRVQAKAQFGLKNMGQTNEYPYFFFQFLTRIASGIDVGNYTPIGSIGVAFYGVGGGIFYNMGYQSPALSGPTGGSSPEVPPPPDGEPIPDPVGQDDLCSFNFPGVYDSLGSFRLEATLVIGITSNSIPVNMDITLGGNLTLNSSAFGASFDIEVKGFLLADVMSDRELSSPAYFIGAVQFGFIARGSLDGLSMGEYPQFDFFMEAGLNTHVQVPPPAILPLAILKGDDPNCGANCAGQLRFAISTDRGNYFRAGTTEYPLNVKMGLGDLVDVKGKLYMMIGEGVPTTVPDLPDPIPSLLNNLAESEEASMLNEGLAANATRERTGTSVSYDLNSTGLGFAYGEQYSAEVGIESSILTAKLNAVVGFDANLSDVGEMCDGGGGIQVTNPDGRTSHWYAMGQAYAGIQGQLSVKDILFGSDQVIPILDIGAVMVVTAGSPNPTFIHGVAGVHLNMFGGMIRGKKYFQVSLGDRCVPPGINDPFNAGDFIAYSLPDDNAQGVSPFVVPEVGFNIEMEKAFTFQEVNDDGSPGSLVNYTPELQEFYLKKGSQTIPCERNWSNSKTICRCETALLEPHKDYLLHAKFAVQGSNYTETIDHPFRTGAMPDSIPREQVAMSFPVDRQRYFHQNERRKFIRFKQDLKSFFNTGIGLVSTDGSVSYSTKFFIRVHDLDGTLHYEKEITSQIANQPNITVLQFPNEEWSLQPNRTYKVSINKKKGAGVDMIASATLMDLSNMSFDQLLSQAQFGDGRQDSVVMESSLEQDEINQSARDDMVEVISWFFRTSQYNALAEKIQAGDLAHENGYFYIDVQEPFDVCDIYGSQHYDPLVSLSHVVNSQPYHSLRDAYLGGIISLKNALTSTSYSVHTGTAEAKHSMFRNSTYSLLNTKSVIVLKELPMDIIIPTTIDLAYPGSDIEENLYLKCFTGEIKRTFSLDPGETLVQGRLSNAECGLSSSFSSMQQDLIMTGINTVSSPLYQSTDPSYRYRIDFSPSIWTEMALKDIVSTSDYLRWQQPYDPDYTMGRVVKKMIESNGSNLWTELEQQSTSFGDNIGYNFSGSLDHIRSHFHDKNFEFAITYGVGRGRATYRGSTNMLLSETYHNPNTPTSTLLYHNLNW